MTESRKMLKATEERVKITEWARVWEQDIVCLANTDEDGWSTPKLNKLGENLIKGLAKAIDPTLFAQVVEHYQQARTIVALENPPTRFPTNLLLQQSEVLPRLSSQLPSIVSVEGDDYSTFDYTDGPRDERDSPQKPHQLKRSYSALEAPSTMLEVPSELLIPTPRKRKPAYSKKQKRTDPANFRPLDMEKSLSKLHSKVLVREYRPDSPEEPLPSITSKYGKISEISTVAVVRTEHQISKKQDVRSHTYRKDRKEDRAPKNILSLIIMSSDKAGASKYEVGNANWALSESILLGAIVNDKPHPVEQPGRLKMVTKDENLIIIKWNEVIDDYAKRGKPPAIVIKGWGENVAFKALGPWFERATKNTDEWETWTEDELIKGSKVDRFIGARD